MTQVRTAAPVVEMDPNLGLERGTHRPFAVLASVTRSASALSEPPQVKDAPSAIRNTPIKKKRKSSDVTRPLTPEQLAEFKEYVIGFLPGEQKVVAFVPSVSRATPPKFPNGVSGDIGEFLFCGNDRGVIPERGKAYGVYCYKNGQYSTMIIGARTDRRDDVVYVRVLDVSGESFRFLAPLRDYRTELAYDLLRNPSTIQNGELRHRVEGLSRFLWLLAKKIKGTGKQRRHASVKQS